MATYVDLDNIQRPGAGLPLNPAWGDQVNDNFTALTSRVLTLPSTWAVSGPIQVTSGSTEYLPGIIIPVVGTQTVALVGVYTSLRAGSAVIQFMAGGVAVAGLGAVSVSTAVTYTAVTGGQVGLTNAEMLQPIVTSVSSSADGLSITALLAYTLG